MGSARETAVLTLAACEKQGAWSDGHLKRAIRAAGLDRRDGALCARLCYGVLQNRLLLDFYLSHFSNLPLKRMEGRVVEALRLGAYQMLFLDKIPHSAAVNASVELTRKHCKNPRAAGMVNGILRNLERNLGGLPTVPQTDPVSYLSTLYSHPEWLVKEFLTALGSEETARLLSRALTLTMSGASGALVGRGSAATGWDGLPSQPLSMGVTVKR